MPFDPAFPPDDPWQWWRTHAQPRFLQPNTPANGASGDPADADGIDDWFVPEQPPKPADSPGTAPAGVESDGYPNDWIYPTSWPAPSATSPGIAPPAPSPPIGTFNPGISKPPLPPTDPLAAYWSTIPASRLAAVAWAPPIFPDAFGRFQLTRPAPAAPLPLTIESGLLGGVGRMLAERAAGIPSFGEGHDLYGAIARLPAASAPRDVWSDGGGQGLLGGIPNLPGVSSLFPSQPRLSDLENDPSNSIVPLRPLRAASNGFADSRAPLGSSEGPPASLIPWAFGADESNSEGIPTANNAIYIYPNLLDQIIPCFASSLGCAGGGGGNRGGGGGGRAGPRPSTPSAPRAPEPEPGPPTPSAPSAPAPSQSPVAAPADPAEASTNAGGSGGPAPAAGGGSPKLGRGKRYEQQHGSQQTTESVIIDGKEVSVRLDFPPTENGIVDLKDYNWSSPGYAVPFLRQKVVESFRGKIRKYQAIHPQVRFQLSQEPP
jgi:hypothetical protein